MFIFSLISPSTISCDRYFLPFCSRYQLLFIYISIYLYRLIFLSFFFLSYFLSDIVTYSIGSNTCTTSNYCGC